MDFFGRKTFILQKNLHDYGIHKYRLRTIDKLACLL